VVEFDVNLNPDCRPDPAIVALLSRNVPLKWIVVIPDAGELRVRLAGPLHVE
jgi:hypothetical protein